MRDTQSSDRQTELDSDKHNSFPNINSISSSNTNNHAVEDVTETKVTDTGGVSVKPAAAAEEESTRLNGIYKDMVMGLGVSTVSVGLGECVYVWM